MIIQCICICIVFNFLYNGWFLRSFYWAVKVSAKLIILKSPNTPLVIKINLFYTAARVLKRCNSTAAAQPAQNFFFASVIHIQYTSVYKRFWYWYCKKNRNKWWGLWRSIVISQILFQIKRGWMEQEGKLFINSFYLLAKWCSRQLDLF